jgi:hypothetical protein
MMRMKNAIILVLALTIPVFACGGMTQIDPPSLQLDAGSSDLDVHSVRNEVQGVVCLV